MKAVKLAKLITCTLDISTRYISYIIKPMQKKISWLQPKHRYLLPLSCLTVTFLTEIFILVANIGRQSIVITIVRVLLHVFTAVVIVFKSTQYYALFKSVITVGVFLTMTLLIVGMYYQPVWVDWLSFEDGAIETLSAFFLFAASIIWILYAIAQIIRRQFFNLLIALGLASIFFIIGMEEISWMQRVLGFETFGLFLARNSQGETNLHNINTTLSETLFYVGGAIMLVIMPFYRDHVSRILARLKLPQFISFLPSRWLLIPFSTIFGLMGLGTAMRPSILFVTIFIHTILIHGIFTTVQTRRYELTAVYIVAAILQHAAVYTFLTFPYELHGIRFWLYTEYIEFFIAGGLLVYTIDFLLRRQRCLLG